MGVNTTGLLNAQAEVYASYKNDAVNKNETSAKKDTTAKTEEKNESGVVYDKSDSSKDNKKATYSINKMSAEDRCSTRTADESGYTVQTAAADQHRAENDDWSGSYCFCCKRNKQ